MEPSGFRELSLERNSQIFITMRVCREDEDDDDGDGGDVTGTAIAFAVDSGVPTPGVVIDGAEVNCGK